MRPVACMISDRLRLRGGADDLIERVGIAARAGVHLIQIRERDLPDGALLTLVRRAVDAARSTRARILVNDRADIAIVAGAHGVHLRSDSVPAARVRAIAPPGFLIGRSVHAPGEAGLAAGDGVVDYLLFGTVFETASKPGVIPAGVETLSEAVAAARACPVLAVGGVTAGTLPMLRRSGCAGFAAIGLFTDLPAASLRGVLADVLVPWENRA